MRVNSSEVIVVNQTRDDGVLEETGEGGEKWRNWKHFRGSVSKSC